jgi:hypothetical protein
MAQRGREMFFPIKFPQLDRIEKKMATKEDLATAVSSIEAAIAAEQSEVLAAIEALKAAITPEVTYDEAVALVEDLKAKVEGIYTPEA